MKTTILTLLLTFTFFAQAHANNKTMDDAGPTNPVNTNRFPSVPTQPRTIKTDDKALINDKNTPPMPTSSPAHR